MIRVTKLSLNEMKQLAEVSLFSELLPFPQAEMEERINAIVRLNTISFRFILYPFKFGTLFSVW